MREQQSGRDVSPAEVRLVEGISEIVASGWVKEVERLTAQLAEARQQRDGYAVLLEEAHSEIGGALQDLEYLKSDIEHGHLDQALRWLCKAEVCLHRADPGTDDHARQIVAAVEGIITAAEALNAYAVRSSNPKRQPGSPTYDSEAFFDNLEAGLGASVDLKKHVDAYREALRSARGAGGGVE